MPLAAHNVKWFKPSNLVRHREDVTHGEQTVAFSTDSSSMSLKAGPSKGLRLIRVTFCFRSCDSERWPCFSATLPKSHVLGHTSLADRRIHRIPQSQFIFDPFYPFRPAEDALQAGVSEPVVSCPSPRSGCDATCHCMTEPVTLHHWDAELILYVAVLTWFNTPISAEGVYVHLWFLW